MDSHLDPDVAFHPDITVALGYSVCESKKGRRTLRSAQRAGVVIVALLHGIFVILLPKGFRKDKTQV